MSDTIPTIKSATVRVLRSHDYCHFEISLSSDDDLLTEQVDDLRKEAARLADKAVEQYKIAKTWATRNLTTTISDKFERLRKLAEIASETPENERTPEEKAIIKAIADMRYAARVYDYQDDWQDENQ